MLYLSISGRCNIACASCGVEDAHRLRRDERELTGDEIVRVIREGRGLGCRVLSLAGGEPMLRKGIADWVAEGSRLGMRVHMNSNGMLLTEERAIRLGRAGLFSVSLSIDHDDPTLNDRHRAPGAYDLALRSIDLFRRHAPRVRVIVNCTVGRHNADRMVPVAKLARDVGADMVKFTPLDTNLQHRFRPRSLFDGLTMTDLDAAVLRSQIDALLSLSARDLPIANSKTFLRGMVERLTSRVRTKCIMGFLTVTVNAWGDVLGCFEIPSGRNIRESSLGEIWNSVNYAVVRDQIRNCQRECWDIGSAEPSLLLDIQRWDGKLIAARHAWHVIGGSTVSAI